MIFALLLVVQAADPWVITPAAPTVGDTVTIERLVLLSPDARLRAQPLAQSALIEPLADPVVLREGRGVLVRYTLAAFEPGRHAVEMPVLEELYRDGRVDIIPADTAWVTVAAVLPAGDSLPPPRPSLAPLARFPRRTVPLLVFTGLALVLAGGWAVARRRRRAGDLGPDTAGRQDRPPVARWISSGESRAVATVAAGKLRERIARVEPRAGRALSTEACIAMLEEVRPEWPVRQLTDVLRDLERARFAPAVDSDVGALVTQVDTLIAGLGHAERTGA